MIRIGCSSSSRLLHPLGVQWKGGGGGVLVGARQNLQKTNSGKRHVHRFVTATASDHRTTKNHATNNIRCISSTGYRPQSMAVYPGWAAGMGKWELQDFLQESTVTEKEAWLESMLDTNYKRTDTECFLIVLNALASATKDDPSAPRRAERWMARLKDHVFAEPTSECYQAVIQAWANSSHERIEVIVNRAKRWLEELMGEGERNPENAALQPTIECYNAFLDACTRGRSGSNKRKQDIVVLNAQRADAILRRLHAENCDYKNNSNNNDDDDDDGYPLAPNTDTFNFVIRGWTRCKHEDLAPVKVMALLKLMESYQRADPIGSKVRPNSKSYCMAMDVLVSTASRKARRCISLSDGRFVTDLSLNGLREIDDAEKILAYMHDLYEGGVEGIVPGTIPYNIMLTGFAKLAKARHNNAPFKAEEKLRKMFAHKDNGFIEAAPDRISFEKVMLAWANSEHPNAGQRANYWLKKLWNTAELESEPALLPTVHTYNIAIQALAASEGPFPAENLLLDLGDKYKEEKSDSLRPNSESFAIVIRTWLSQANNETQDREEGVNALKRSFDWLISLRDVQNETELTTSQFSTSPELYVGILKVAKIYAKGDHDVLDLANQVFKDMKKSRHKITHAVYCLLLEVGLAALSGPDCEEERSEFLTQLFHECCDDGVMSSRFVRILANSRTWSAEESKAMVDTLLPDWPVPHYWCMNLPSHKLHPKQSDSRRVRHLRTTWKPRAGQQGERSEGAAV